MNPGFGFSATRVVYGPTAGDARAPSGALQAGAFFDGSGTMTSRRRGRKVRCARTRYAGQDAIAPLSRRMRYSTNASGERSMRINRTFGGESLTDAGRFRLPAAWDRRSRRSSLRSRLLRWQAAKHRLRGPSVHQVDSDHPVKPRFNVRQVDGSSGKANQFSHPCSFRGSSSSTPTTYNALWSAATGSARWICNRRFVLAFARNARMYYVSVRLLSAHSRVLNETLPIWCESRRQMGPWLSVPARVAVHNWCEPRDWPFAGGVAACARYPRA